jgi:selenocysteine lyase/cysteine desulfurase
MPEAEKVAAVRQALPAVGAGIYLNTGSAGPIPAETAAVMAELEGWEVRTGRASAEFFEDFLERLAESRAGIAAVLAGDVDSIAITHSTTEGMNIATWAVDWKPGDRAVTTSHEHAGGLGPLVAARDRFGIDLAFVDVGDGTDDEATLVGFDRAITPTTKLVAISHVLWTTGARLPIERIARLAKERGATVAIDGAQAVGAVPVSIDDLGVDYYAVAAQKWLLGPEGIGARGARSGTADPRRLVQLRQPRARGDRPVLPRGPPVRGDELPQAVGHRVRPELRLAVDVRRAAVGLRPRSGPGRLGLRPAGEDSGRDDADAARADGDARDVPDRRLGLR